MVDLTIKLGAATVAQLKKRLSELTDYPKVFEDLHSGRVVKFTSLTSGVTLQAGTSGNTVGDLRHALNPHTDTDSWKQLQYNKQLDLYDGQLCYGWDDCNSPVAFGFYNHYFASLTISPSTSDGRAYEHYSSTIPTHMLVGDA